ncbi:bifunctional diaminohydroxyphosphoribosylaminopyrimidine deaminase/5-amino-6-(5-phosphoribosylamino)uracil reductase RibD [Nonomuraea sp. NPDC047897]|uniref:bifunctional diaminohydroxyphosphoribosylaminopyrimidine deaminase/5-amino-6-(5-phosphoribosylamino)uracil reductase RibD n=1 Tax=Nonomuraea sp. NPDC047897 TaxID=3364346 RepID=UPI00371F5FC1
MERPAAGRPGGVAPVTRARHEDVRHMARAVVLAARGHGTTSPNPVVGCVVLDATGRVAGEGFHAYAGGPHAEVVALRQAGERARGGTAYVTLEPCDHTGRTGPCSEALLDAGIACVVIAVADPNPKAAGGADRLRAHGVVVETGVLAIEAERVNAEWLTFARLGRPHVTWKFAATLDGRSAAADGTSQWITSPEARADVHRLRARADAVMAGIGTVLADDPRLTARPVQSGQAEETEQTGQAEETEQTGQAEETGQAGQAEETGKAEQTEEARRAAGAGAGGAKGRRRAVLRVVVDTEARTPATARVLDGEAPTLIAVAPDVPAPDVPAPDVPVPALDAGVAGSPDVELVRVPRHPGGGLDLHALLGELARRGVVSVFLEGGPTLAGAFLAQGLVDRVVAYVAPALLGSGAAALGDAGVATIAGVHRLAFDDVRLVGPDLRLTARPRPSGSPPPGHPHPSHSHLSQPRSSHPHPSRPHPSEEV